MRIIAIMLICSVARAQPDPVHLTYAVNKTAGKKYEIHIRATLDNGWHIYSQLQPAEAIARPTKIEWVKNPLVILSGSTKEIGRKEKYENKEAGIVQFQYGAACEFVQALTLKAKVKTNMAGLITYQVCTDKMCLPPKTVEFKVGLNQ